MQLSLWSPSRTGRGNVRSHLDDVQLIPHPDFPCFHNRAFPTALCRTAVETAIRMEREAYDYLATKAMASETRVMSAREILVDLITEVWDTIFAFATEKH